MVCDNDVANASLLEGEHNRMKNAKAMPTRFSLYTRTLHTFVPQFIRNAVSSATLDASSRETSMKRTSQFPPW